jgi:hypothetical protein
MNRNVLVAVVIVVALGVCLFFVGRHYIRRLGIQPVPMPVVENNHKVLKIGILTGSEFDLKIGNGGERVHVKLTVTAAPESKEQVVRFINGCSNPRVVLLKKTGDVWTADLFLYVKETGKEVSLAEWLKFNNLAWENH